MKRVIIGMSGGVDSSVAAYLLKKQGYDLLGVYMKNWHDSDVTISKECPWLEDSHDAMLVAKDLDIPFQVFDFSQEYKTRIVDYMIGEYREGRTPNPDVLCNREIKFDLFLKLAMEMDADYIATGHYCNTAIETINNQKIYKLLPGEDKTKDQSYFLCQLNQYQLSKTIFPLGKYTKKEIRAIAKEQQLITAAKKDSQGLCFIGKVELPVFLQQSLKPQKGKIIEIDKYNPLFQGVEDTDASDLESNLRNWSAPFVFQPDDGTVIGEHRGAHFFTIGQRKGLSVGGKEAPLYVIGVDTAKNILYVCMGSDHPGLYRKALSVSNDQIHWINPFFEEKFLTQQQPIDIKCRIRYRQPLKGAKLYRFGTKIYVVFDKKQKAITSGQFVVFHYQDEVVGSGVID